MNYVYNFSHHHLYSPPGKFVSCRGQLGTQLKEYQIETEMYKRPIPRSRGKPVQEFVTKALPGGATTSYWAPSTSHYIVPTGHPSRVGEILDKMRGSCVPPRSEKRWAPPLDYEYIASHMTNPEPFLKRCRDWFAANPPKVYTPPPPPPVINQEPIIAVFAKYARVPGGPRVPPVSELAKAMRAAGHTELRITRCEQWFQNLEDRSDERQEALDLIFAKFPSANKPLPKSKTKKVIKVVKKKMPGSSNEQTTVG